MINIVHKNSPFLVCQTMYSAAVTACRYSIGNGEGKDKENGNRLFLGGIGRRVRRGEETKDIN